MKKLITSVQEQSGAEYQLWAELSDCPNPEGYKLLEFSSIWTGAKNPKLEKKKGRFFLSPEALVNFKELLEAA